MGNDERNSLAFLAPVAVLFSSPPLSRRSRRFGGEARAQPEGRARAWGGS